MVNRARIKVVNIALTSRHPRDDVESLRLPRRGLAECGLRSSKPRDRNAIGRAGHVIQPDLVTEGDRGRIAAMFAANADLELRPRLAAALDADLDQFADAVAIDRDERIDLQNAARNIGAEESGGVVAADAVGGLRQIVGAEGEEFRGVGDVARSHRPRW